MTHLDPEAWSRLDSIKGWLSPAAADFTCRLLSTTPFRDTQGALVEIGVFKGKYLALVAYATRGQRRRMVGIDGFFAGYQKPLDEKWTEVARAEMVANICKESPEQAVEIVQANSEDLSPRSFKSIVKEQCAFMSIDGGHDAHEVYNDFRISCGNLADGGVIAADDVFNAVVPGVAEGFFRFLTSTEGRRLAPFAACGNKLFLCTTDFHAQYVAAAHGFLEGAQDGYLLRSKAHVENNARIGFVPRMFGFEVVPFLA